MVQQARLIHGSIYTLNGGRGGKSKTWRGVPDPVANPEEGWLQINDKEREWLEENALERVVISQSGTKRTQFIPKFEFREGVVSKEGEEVTGDGDGGKPATRTRSRSR